MNSLQQRILKDVQIMKFCAYGFLKNLRFFEPYLLIYLMSKDISLLQIGVLYSIREIAINVLEVPSGVMADTRGRKRSLQLSFVLYIISFILFFLSDGFSLAVLAMAFYGLGDAFRSGTHKAMIYSYLDLKDWAKEKTFVYGRTRSYSLIGTTLSSVAAIIIVLNVEQMDSIFLFAVIPYILDFILINSYPESINFDNDNEKIKTKDLLSEIRTTLRNGKELRKIIISEGLFASIFKVIKDFIQPIMESIFIGGGLMLIANMSAEDNLKIVLGIVYAVINIFSAYASRSSYLLERKFKTSTVFNGLFIGLSLILLSLGIFIDNVILVFVFYFLINIVFNFRKPIYAKVIDENIDKKERATMLSIVSLLTSLLVVIIAPISGYLADTIGLAYLMIILAFIIILPAKFITIE